MTLGGVLLFFELRTAVSRLSALRALFLQFSLCVDVERFFAGCISLVIVRCRPH